jgi:hypothetical protein
MAQAISDICHQTHEEVAGLEATVKADPSKVLKVEVLADNSGKFCGNGMTFKTADEALKYGNALYGRWTLMKQFRVIVGDNKRDGA